MKIAVIGSGISGLSAAWLLDGHHQVTLYERDGRPGGHTNTVHVPAALGGEAVDTGFIVYNERNYPQLTALFAHLGVPTRATDMSFSVSLNAGRMEYAGDNFNTLFAQRSNLLRWGHWRMLADIVRFNSHAARSLHDPLAEQQSLDEFLRAAGFGAELRDCYLLPMGAAIWSCPPEQMRRFPAATFLRFFHNHGLLSLDDRPVWRTVSGGSHVYIQRMLERLRAQVRLGQGAARVMRDAAGVTVVDEAGRHHRHDQVVFATHADQTLALLDRPGFWERTLLGSFGYQHNRAVLHTDTALMPRRGRVWSSWNYLGHTDPEGRRRLSVSYWMNRLQGLTTATPVIVTLNPLRAPAPEKVIAEFEYEHPVFDARAMQAQPLLGYLQGRHRSWYCGSYFGHGFHEDGLRSAIAVAAGFGVRPPWESAAQTAPVSGPSGVQTAPPVLVAEQV